jgi:hypothetical protein
MGLEPVKDTAICACVRDYFRSLPQNAHNKPVNHGMNIETSCRLRQLKTSRHRGVFASGRFVKLGLLPNAFPDDFIPREIGAAMFSEAGRQHCVEGILFQCRLADRDAKQFCEFAVATRRVGRLETLLQVRRISCG